MSTVKSNIRGDFKMSLVVHTCNICSNSRNFCGIKLCRGMSDEVRQDNIGQKT